MSHRHPIAARGGRCDQISDTLTPGRSSPAETQPGGPLRKGANRWLL
jgi:hypothetical protein